jgi:hypothetical protein
MPGIPVDKYLQIEINKWLRRLSNARRFSHPAHLTAPRRLERDSGFRTMGVPSLREDLLYIANVILPPPSTSPYPLVSPCRITVAR